MQLPARPPDVFQVPVAGTWRQGVDVEEFLSLQSWGTSPTPLATPAGAVGKRGAIGHIAAVPSHRAISSCQLGLCPYMASYSHPWRHRTRSIADARWLGFRRDPPPRTLPCGIIGCRFDTVASWRRAVGRPHGRRRGTMVRQLRQATAPVVPGVLLCGAHCRRAEPPPPAAPVHPTF